MGDDDEDEKEKSEDYKKLQEEVLASKPKAGVRVGPPQIERYELEKTCSCFNILKKV